jgi:hypothetical protein
MKKIFVGSLFLILFLLSAADAQEVFIDYGSTRNISTDESSFYWSIEYLHWWDNLGLSASWPNEGHFVEDNTHHRDGQSAQVWLRKFIVDEKLSIIGGVGPYLYYDTVGVVQDLNYHDEHGLGIEYSVAGVWYLNNNWIVKLQGNYIETFDSFDTFSASVGLGYLFWNKRPEEKEYENILREYNNEITVFFGGVIVNSFDSENNIAEAVEYKRELGEHFDWSVSFINEGDAERINRKGVASQLWLTNSVFEDSLSLGVGAGPYAFYDEYMGFDNSDSVGVAGLVTFSVGYNISERWLSRVSWNRVLSDYNRDTDIILLGLGYKF